jgi:hypothetical protein
MDFSDLLVFPKEYNILKEQNILKTERFSRSRAKVVLSDRDSYSMLPVLRYI